MRAELAGDFQSDRSSHNTTAPEYRDEAKFPLFGQGQNITYERAGVPCGVNEQKE